MADKVIVVDDTTGKKKKGSTSGGPPVVQDYDVGGGGQANFVVTNGTFSASTYIEVRINGQEVREGASHDFQRNVSLNRIDFNFTVPQNAWVRVRLYL